MSTKLSLILVALVLIISSGAECAKILGVFPTAARSHYILGSTLMRGLAEKGHDVTVISPFGETDPPKNGSYRAIVTTGAIEQHERRMKEMNFFEWGKKNLFEFIATLIKLIMTVSDTTLGDPNVQKLLNSDEKFDVVIIEQFANDAHKALAKHFKAPLIVFSTIGANSFVNKVVGNPSPLSYISIYLLGYPSEMTFVQRCVNSLMYFFMEAIQYFLIFPGQDQLIKQYIDSSLNLDDVMYTASLVLLNSHPSTSQPVPHVPSMIEIGGFHVKPPKKLPKDLQEFLDDAKDGVIYFSLGSNMKSAFLPVEKRQIFLDTFSKLNVKVLWKWEEDVLPGQPKNVRVGKWLPQQDILAHPNVKLFITHGGLLSTTETIYHGVPVLALPLAADQKLNAKVIGNEGFGLWLELEHLTEEILTKNINELLENKKYSESAKRRSDIFHDRLVHPMDEAVYWVEYVIRHKGAPHLRVAGLDLPWYKYLLLDVIGTLLVANLLIFFVSYKIIKKVVSKCYKRGTKKLKTN